MSKNTKTEIFKHATIAFSEFGYKNTSLDQIAKMSGVGKSTIYHYVDSKRTLFKEIIDTEVQYREKIVQDFLSKPVSYNDITDHLIYFRENQLNPELIKKIINESKQIGTTEAFEELARLEQCNHDLMKDILLHLKVTEQTETNIELLAFLIVETFNLLTWKWEEGNVPLDYSEIKKQMNAMFFNM
ncbi:TetR/AcrR family transcriptional regulator [Sutcliffiella rhizosphaerae]|uniref:HTH tetR-type domain-containing protein n=1 Tax=Sutcliffiella rhizosphaerae TaxID=2880967 RepID=A0ABM8YUJ6_9BACI|nr:TetR/AcrR family transcriptional regulator [Sutcliffiella rhizosphaerae]CAG9623656.1 hypothetical protein BACCIP111883_04474 [Sutcliffiella rhizosphaerae]